jgi:DNA-binding SARP family transcriptional activator
MRTGPEIQAMPEAKTTLQLLGGIEIHGLDRGRANELLGQPKLVALLSYLSIEGAGGRWHRRDLLVALFWPELDQTRARAALRKGVHALRSVFGAGAVLSRGDEEVRLADGAVTCDVVEFGIDLDAGRLARALERYQGDLMPGFHVSGCVELDRWLEDTRTELRERAAASAWAMAKLLGDDAALTEAGAWAKKAVRYSWSNERMLRHALALIARGGDRAGALRLYEEFASRLKADLDALPSDETVALVNQIRG